MSSISSVALTSLLQRQQSSTPPTPPTIWQGTAYGFNEQLPMVFMGGGLPGNKVPIDDGSGINPLANKDEGGLSGFSAIGKAIKSILDNAEKAAAKFGAAAAKDASHATAQLADFIQKNGFNIVAKILTEMEQSQTPVSPQHLPQLSAPAHWQEYPGLPSAAQLSAVSGIAAQLGPQGIQALAAILPFAGQLASVWKQDGLLVNITA
uniref:Uncharacterized protein n=1 Tax=mine drainage metagenome TaxID=410659 RepID=E6Q4X1_9ZZZZ